MHSKQVELNWWFCWKFTFIAENFSRNYDDDDDVEIVVCIVKNDGKNWKNGFFPIYVNRQTFCGRIWSYNNISKCLQSSGKLTIICVCNTFYTRMSHRVLHGTLNTRRESVFFIHVAPSPRLFYSNVFYSFLCKCIQYTRLQSHARKKREIGRERGQQFWVREHTLWRRAI